MYTNTTNDALYVSDHEAGRRLMNIVIQELLPRMRTNVELHVESFLSKRGTLEGRFEVEQRARCARHRLLPVTASALNIATVLRPQYAIPFCCACASQGLSWPFEDTMDMDAFRAYFLSHAAFVVRASPSTSPASSVGTPSGYDLNRDSNEPERERCLDPTQESRDGIKRSAENGTQLAEQQLKAAAAETKEGDGGEAISDVWGAFYIKPNFPGRCSHVCNGGFITEPRKRRRGVARLMGHAFLRFAKELGYKASYFNLVFRTNEASVRLWRGLGFKELAVVPKAGRLKGIEGLVDAIQFHYDLEQLCLDDLPEELRA